MPAFEKLFRETRGEPIEYQGVRIKRIDKFPVKNGDVLLCSIEEAIKKEGYLQGFCIDVTGYVTINGEIFKKGKGVRKHFFDELNYREGIIEVFTKLDCIIVYNVCEVDSGFITTDENGNPIKKHFKRLDSQYNGAAMIVEEIEDGRRYRCSDTNSAEKPFPFNDIVFTVKKL